MNPRVLQEGHVVQLNPDTCRNRAFGGCFMIVTDPNTWGAQGYITPLGVDRNTAPAGLCYYRANWDEMEPVVAPDDSICFAPWVASRDVGDDAGDEER